MWQQMVEVGWILTKYVTIPIVVLVIFGALVFKRR